MDIKNIFDFESRVESLVSSDSEIKDDMRYQEKFMNSVAINSNFSKIESNLNILYERVRILEELIDYARVYVSNEIDETIKDCRNLLSEIENINDLIFDDTKNFIITNVPLTNNDSAQYIDRDGSLLKTCEVYNNVITLSGTIKDTVEVDTVSFKSTEQVYENNPKSLINNEAYRSFYLLDSIPNNGITETITLGFDRARNINSIKVKLANCKIIGIIYIHEDNTEFHDNGDVKGIMPIRALKAVRLLINATTYTPKTVTVNATETNRYELLESGWREVHSNIKDKDVINLTNNYQKEFCDYLDELYLNKGE